MNQVTKRDVAFASIGKRLIPDFNINIHFAHRTFKWSNEAKGNAAVFCVIIGFANFETNDKYIFEYENIADEPHTLKVGNKQVNGKVIQIK